MHGVAPVEVVRVPHRAELALLPTLDQVVEVEVARRGDRVLASVDPAAKVLAAPGGGGGQQLRLPVRVEREHLLVEIDLDAVGLTLRLLRHVVEMGECEVDALVDHARTRETEVLLHGRHRVLRVLVEDVVDVTRIEVQFLHAGFVDEDRRTAVALADPAAGVGQDLILRLFDGRDRGGRRTGHRGGLRRQRRARRVGRAGRTGGCGPGLLRVVDQEVRAGSAGHHQHDHERAHDRAAPPASALFREAGGSIDFFGGARIV